VQVTLIDKNDSFKFDLMFGRASMSDVSLYYRDLVKLGVEFRQETVTSIDAAAKK
jgi:sulfide:quinone oxidoreductase|tara:strand:+ start:267 stop:431 length:165 start_codon:yes stop_codon:yes gene_type:complete